MYDLELEKAIEKIKENNSKTICVQLPDGLKPKAKEIVDTINLRTGAKVFIWLGSDFGACDIPLELQNIEIDLLISWGHNIFNKESGW